ncbi:MAG: gliding motility-associated C-terminal domain-containing protein [Saprospiraceae bacterium]|nr:gliding motility-associated C-terminal domain-containing protein [Saprospiraceae bacterium]
MYYKIIPLLIILFAGKAMAQTPMPIQLAKPSSQLEGEKAMACADQFAGTISFNNFQGSSNDIDLDTIYFCFGDEIGIVHNGNANLTGDPVPGQAGITYAYLNCEPTISGPDLATILTDPCIIDNPAPTNNLWITAGGQQSGNITFNNSGVSQNLFNNGDPVLLWFAPITIDQFPNTYESQGGGPAGPCVNMNVAEAFAVVYLNRIEATPVNTNSGLSGCEGSFVISGGLPEFDGSTSYSFDITLVGNNSVKGTVVGGPYTHGSTVEFQVPVAGVYRIDVEDGKSCDLTLFANMSGCTSVTQSVQSLSAVPGDLICLNVTNEAGFNNIAGMNYGLTWDETVLQFSNVTNLNPMMPNFSPITNFNSNLGDTLILVWFNPLAGVTLPDGAVLYQVCFNVIGGDGDCTNVSFISPSGGPIDIVNAQGAQLGFNGLDGTVCVSNSAILMNFTTTPVTCPNGSNGSFTITVSNGVAPYQVTWQNVNGGPTGGPGTVNISGGNFTATNLAAGTYSVTVLDSDNPTSSKTQQVIVAGPPPLAINFASVEPLCNGDANGSLTANLISGGMPVLNPLNNYSFAWSVPGSGSMVGNLVSGNYTVTVTNNANPACTLVGLTFLDEPTPLNVIVNTTPATCTGIGDGTIFVTVSGGTPNALQDYTITFPTIAGGFTQVNTSTSVLGLESDFYPLIVTDFNGCSIDQNIFVPVIKLLDFNVLFNGIGCGSPCSGEILVTAFTTGGNPNTTFNFDWSGSPVPPPPVAETNNSSQMVGLCAGNLNLVIETPDGCVLDTNFVMGGATDLDLVLVASQNESCVPGGNGSIVVQPIGGTPSYTYTWSANANTGNSSVATNLSAGSYSVTVLDSDGCRDSLLAINISAPTPPSITNLPDDMVSCANSTDGSLTVTFMPGNFPVTSVQWSNNQSGATISNLPPGSYTVTITDAGGCNIIGMAEVLASSQIVIDSFQTTPPNCPGLGGGQVIAFVSGGALPYQFDWSNGLSGLGFNSNPGLTAGTYNVTVSGANGCPPAMGSITLDDPPSIVATFSAIDSVSCANVGQTCDGTATGAALYSDGTPGSFNFIWISGETDNNVAVSSAQQLCAGSQRLIVSDGVCNDTFFVDIPAPLPIMPGQDIENVSCNGLSDGQITLMPSGGTAPYDIVWQDGTVGPVLSDLAVGTYTAMITDAKNCNFSHSVAIVQPLPFEVFLNPTQTQNLSCPGEPDGSISVVAQGGNLGNLVYLWQNSVAGTTEATATGLAAGNYSITVVDPEGCTDSLTHTLSEPPPIQFRLGEAAQIQCFGQTTTITVDTVWGGNSNAAYVFSSGTCIQLALGQACPVVAGDHTIEVQDVFNGCVVDTTITIAEPPEITVVLPPSIEVELGDSLTTLDPTIVSAFPIDTFLWTPAEGLSCFDCKNPRVLAIEPATYTLTIVDVNGCSAMAQVFVDIDNNRNVYIPNVFSPNGDGINDKFQVFTGLGVLRINAFRVYDRWGELMFEEQDIVPSNDGTVGWDGEFRGQRMRPAMFVYAIEVEFIDGRKLLYKGDFTLLK